MAAPVVSSIAAVLRSNYSDESEYNSRFIMGQIVSATDLSTIYKDKFGELHEYARADLYHSITKFPEPNLSVAQAFVLDNIELSEENDGDNIIDAGETVNLGISIRNQWGKTGEITVRANATSDGGVDNPYVEFINDTVTLDPCGTFSNVDNGFVYNDGYLETIDNPIQFVIAPETPNDTEIAIYYTVETTNGWDEDDDTIYNIGGEKRLCVTFRVQSGTAISGHISEDTTLTSDKYWIVENAIVIDEGVTLTIEPGTQIQFWSSDFEDAYGQRSIVYIKNFGTLNAIGTESNPIEMFPGASFEKYAVMIDTRGVENLVYCSIINPLLQYDGAFTNGVDLADHCILTQTFEGINYRRGVNAEASSSSERIYIDTLSNSIVKNIYYGTEYGASVGIKESVNCIFINCSMSQANIKSTKDFLNCVFIGGKPFTDKYGTITKISTLRKLAKTPKAIPEFTEIQTYENSHSKYVFMKPYEHYELITLDYLRMIANCLGGTLGCLNDKDEQEFIIEQLYLLGEETREEDNNGAINTNAFLGGIYNSDTQLYEWEDKNPYVSDIQILPTNYGYPILSFGVSGYADSKRYASLQGARLDRLFTTDRYILFEIPSTISNEKIKEVIKNLNNNDYYSDYFNNVDNNAILNPFLNSDTNTWIKFQAPEYNTDYYYSIANNYWGTENSKLINRMIIDDDDYPGLYSNIVETPILTLESESLEEIYPFVTNIWLTEQDSDIPVEFAAPGQTYEVHVTYNRDMDSETQPYITYGGDAPYTDYLVTGDWISEREWVGTTKISSVSTGGTQIFRAKGGCAADDKWLVCGTDELRFQFEINSSSVLAMVLNATGGIDKIDLEWIQNDYELLAGYNLYRKTKPDGYFSKLNTTTLTDTYYTDTDVQPGVEYYYYFTVVDTDGNEVEGVKSNVASAAPLDNVKPTITHSPVGSAKANSSVTVSAKANDNIGVASVSLYYKKNGDSTFTKKTMSYSDATGMYTTTIPSSAVTAAGIEYYLEVKDSTGNSAYSGSSAVPYAITTDGTPSLLAVTPSVIGIEEENVSVTVYGKLFTEEMTVKLGNVDITEFSVSENGEQFTFTASKFAVGTYPIAVTLNGKTAYLNSGITYRDVSSYVQINEATVASNGKLNLPVYVGLEGDLTAFYAEIKIPTSNYSYVSAKVAEGINATVSSHYNGMGTLKISMASATSFKPADDSSPLFYVYLEPGNVQQATETQITLRRAELNGANVVPNEVHTTVTILPCYTVDATVTYYNGGAAVPGVTVSVAGKNGVTDSKGNTVIGEITRQDVTVTVTKDDYSEDAIDPYDVSLILQSRVGLIELSDNQLLAADVNGDGNVNEVDASLILQKSVFLIDSFPAGAWKFVPPSKTLTIGEYTRLSFSAVLVGDVDGSWKVSE